MEIGFIGLGQMGSAMAANLLKAGHVVTVYNRNQSKADGLVAAGAKRAVDAAGACKGQLVFSMLADDAAVEAVTFGERGILAGLGPDGIHVSSSTISVEMAKRLAAAHGEAGQRYLSAPVFGRPEAAAAAKLFVVVAGAPAAVEICRPLLETLGQRVFPIAEQPEAANLVKLSGNFLIFSVIEAVGEAMALVSKAGIDRRAYLDILTSTLFNSPIYATYGALIADRTFEPARFAAPLGSKDLRLALAAANDLEVPMPVASLIHDRFLRLLAGGGDKMDVAALGGMALEDAGL
jgi:3-hydroxyisobutyrate dehydrogenase-like beta-hydroxyacid dehydrogenase